MEKRNVLENEFIERINEVYDKCTGFETYGNTTEFFDEDGVVLMTAEKEENKKIIFTFTEDSQSYEYEELKED